jgi:hypothetical protein
LGRSGNEADLKARTKNKKAEVFDSVGNSLNESNPKKKSPAESFEEGIGAIISF